MRITGPILACIACVAVVGCVAPTERLTFPPAASRGDDAWRYDVNGDGRNDFALLLDAEGRCAAVAYDDDQDGHDDRVYRLAEYDADRLPHVVLMIDSVPHRTVAARAALGEWPWFAPPSKVIPPFPTMSGVIFSTILHAPPLGGMINRHYDRTAGAMNNMIVRRSMGERNPWHLRLHYMAKYWENGLAFIEPRRWYGVEMARAMRAVDASPDRVTVLYIASASGMLSKYGEQGANEVLDLIEPFCVGLLHQRQGAVRISVLSDHGHNYVDGKHVDVPGALREAGFRVGDRLRGPDDVVVEADGLINYIGLHTHRAAAAAAAVTKLDAIELACYIQGESVIVRDGNGSAAVDYRDETYRYRVIDHDVLGYGSIVASLRERADADGYVAAADWLAATADHRYPDAPVRLWRAFHGLVIHPPDVMLTTRDGYYGGIGMFKLFIHMKSTHGGIDQNDSAAFLMGMDSDLPAVMRSEDVLPAILPKGEVLQWPGRGRR